MWHYTVRLGPFALDVSAQYPVDVLAVLERRLLPVSASTDALPRVTISLSGGAETAFRRGFGIVRRGGDILRHDFCLRQTGPHAWTAQTLPRWESAEAVLRWLVGWELLNRGGMLLHASSVVVDGRAHVFLGASGDGKTTTAHCAKADRILCDEVSLVARDRADAWHAWPSPFWGDGSYGTPGAEAPLAALWVLRGRNHTGWLPLPSSDAALELCQRTIDLSADEDFPDLLLAQIHHLLERVPARALSFHLSDRLRPVLAGAEPTPFHPTAS